MENGDGGPAVNYPKTVDEVFRDFKGRMTGMIKALTTDFEDFYRLCDPEKENLCLYGYPNEEWEVNLPAEEVPPALPEPVLGINFARDGMQEKDWLCLVAVHSDAWLLAVASYFGARFGFNKYDRKCLFGLISELPTIFEIVSGKKQKASATHDNTNKSKSNSKACASQSMSHNKLLASRVTQEKVAPALDWEDKEEEEEEEEEEHGGETLCGSCNGRYAADEFWICCDICEKWFHGKCVKITPARAEHIKQYKCPLCSSNKRVRP